MQQSNQTKLHKDVIATGRKTTIAWEMKIVVLYIAALVCVFTSRLHFATCETTEEPDKPTLYLLALAPYPDPEGRPSFTPKWDGGPGVIPAGRLAVDHINNNTNVLPEYNLELIVGDSGCDISSKALISYTREVIHGEKRVMGIVGPICTWAALALAGQAAPQRTSMVQMIVATSPVLENRIFFPNTFSTLGSARILVNGVMTLIKVNNWSRIAVIYDGLGVYYKSIFNILLEELSATNQTCEIVVSSPVYETYFPLEQIETAQVRIIVVLAAPKLAQLIMCQAYHYPIYYPNYQWVILERDLPEFQNVPNDFACTPSQMEVAVNNAILVHWTTITQNHSSPTRSGFTYDDFAKEYKLRVEQHERELGININKRRYSTIYYDSVWAMALGLDHLAKSGVNLLEYYPERNGNITELLKKKLYELDFEGTSGRIKFDSSTGRVHSLANIFQVQNGTRIRIGYYNSSVAIPNEAARGIFVSDSFEIRYTGIRTEVMIAVLAITGIQFVLIVSLHVLNIACSKYKSIKASSPKLNHLIFVGCYLMILSIMIFAVMGSTLIAQVLPADATIRTVMCNMFLWLMNLGLALMLATVCIKTWRIYRIFIHFTKPGGQALTDPVLIVIVLLLTVPVIVGSLIWSLVDPVRGRKETNYISDNGTPIIEITVTCLYPWYDILIKIYHALLLLCAQGLSLINRHINTKFKTTKSITALVYSLLLISSVGFALYFISQQLWPAVVSYVVLCVTLNAILFVCIIFMFVPQTIPLLKEKGRAHARRVSTQVFPLLSRRFSKP